MSTEAGPSRLRNRVLGVADDGDGDDSEESEGSGSGSDYVTESESDEEQEEDDESELGDDAVDDEEEELGNDGLGQLAETQIEDDFDRLVKNIRVADVADNASVLSKAWDFTAHDHEAEFKDDLRAASGIGKQKRKRGRRATGPVLSQQVLYMIGEGNQAYVDGDVGAAVRAMQEVIRIEPRAASAWTVLAQCHADAGEHEQALQLRIMAAHLLHDAEEWERLARQSRELGFSQQALYCYRKIYSLDPTNVDALWERASLAREIGDLRTARNALVTLLKRFPHDLAILDQLRPLLIELSELSFCAQLFQDAFEHHAALYPAGPPHDAPQNAHFGLMETLVLADSYNTLGQHARAVNAIRRGARWLQGRAGQKFWDTCGDDREFDLPEGAGGVQREGEVKPGCYPLDLNARHRLAVARIRMGDVEEGKMHAGIILAEDVLDYALLFAEIADAYYERDLFEDALPIYEVLSEQAETSSMYVLLQVASCHRLLGDMEEAAQVYDHVITVDPTLNDAKMKLAEIYEIMNEPRKALTLVHEVIDSRRRRQKTADSSTQDGATPGPAQTSLFEEKAPAGTGTSKAKRHKLTQAQLRALEDEREREVQRGYKRLQDLWPAMLRREEEAEREWMVEAEKMVDSYRETRNLFLANRSGQFRGMFPTKQGKKQYDEADEERMASRLHLDLEQDSAAKKSKSDPRETNLNAFRGVSFDDWLNVFIQYAFILTQKNKYSLADEVLRHILLSNPYQKNEYATTIRLAIITCAIAGQQYNSAVEQVRKLINTHQFNNEPFRILLAALASGLKATDAFIVSPLQKHILREVRLHDAAARNRDAVRWNGTTKRYYLASGASKKGEEEDEDDAEDGEEDAAEEKMDDPLPTKDNPLVIGLYGQLCVASKSFQSAIFYLLHAYDYCSEDPVICLSLAIAYMGRAMQRQADNRHYFITQAMAFLSRYRKIRGDTAEGMEEVEYNFGRAFHQLALYTHAVRHYERVLTLAEARIDESCGLAREAAYNLSLIYVITGAAPLAKALYRRWLTI